MHNRRSPFAALIFATFMAWLAPAPAGQQEIIFMDSLEFVVEDCVSGPGPGTPLTGDLGPAPGGPHEFLTCLEVSNDRDLARVGEIAWGGIPISRDWNLTDPDLDRLALIGPDGRRIAAQFDVLSRWGGPLADNGQPVRWLEVAFPASLEPAGASPAVSRYALRRYADPIPAVDSLDTFAVSVNDTANPVSVDSGMALWQLDSTMAYLLETVMADPDDDGTGPFSLVYQHQAGAGPYLQFDPGGGPLMLDSATPGSLVVDPDGFRIHRRGPVRTVFVLRGHLVAPGGNSLCTTAGVTPYERFGFTATVTIGRASRDAVLEFNLRNECSDAFTSPFDNESIVVEGAGWRLPSALTTPTALYHDGNGIQAAGMGVTRVISEQRKGDFAGDGVWRRRARVGIDGMDVVTAEFLHRPVAALADSGFLVAAQMPWMRFREPQALIVDGGTVDAAIISRPLPVGEGKGLWNFIRFAFVPRAGDAVAQTEQVSAAGQVALERPLLPRLPLAKVNDAGLWPSLGSDAPSDLLTAYERYINEQHDNTVRAGDSGQWQRAKTYGSQLWPDTQADDRGLFPGELADQPANNNGAMNYWNPNGAELLEFLRSGEPRWSWDFALPQAWLQIYSARLNIGDHDHGLRNGVAVDSGGTGEGHWHRNGGGSDDYTYNLGSHLAYALRPLPSYHDRLRHGGRMIVNRYSVPWNPNDPGNTNDPAEFATQTDRDRFLNAVAPTRLFFQHYELLANCAEFVAGAQGQACDARLHELMTELANDNLRVGLICQDDVPVDDFCDMPQSFMTNAMMYHWLLRYFLNYGDVQNLAGEFTLSRSLREHMQVFYAQGMDQRPGVGGPDASGNWAYTLGCPLTNGATMVGACQWFDTGDGFNMYQPNKPHTVALGFISHNLGGADSLCSDSRRLMDELFAGLDPVTNPYGPLGGFVDGGGGWWKGASQAIQMLVFALGGYDQCQAAP